MTKTPAIIITCSAGDANEPDDAQAARRTRFGRLPERIGLADMVEGKRATVPDPARDTYNSDEWLVRTCL